MTPTELAALHNRCFTVPRPYSKAEFEQFLATKTCFLVSNPFGFALGRAVAGEAELLTLAVDPSYRRLGHGCALLESFHTQAQKSDASKAFLEVASNNSAAIALYKAIGYCQVGQRPAYYRMPTGANVDAICMQKTLIHS